MLMAMALTPETSLDVASTIDAQHEFKRRLHTDASTAVAVAKKELHKLQKYNNQVISRAEKKKLKQSTLSF